MQAEDNAGMVADHGVVHLHSKVDEAIGVVAPLPVARANVGIEQGGVLGRIDLDVAATEAYQFRHLVFHDVHDVGEIGIDGRISARRFLRIVIRCSLLRANHRDLRRTVRSCPQVGELFRAQRTLAAQLRDRHRPLLHYLLAGFVAERNGPPAELVEAFHGIDEMTVERIAAQFAVGNHVQAEAGLQRHRFVHCAIFDFLERGVVQLSRIMLLSRLLQILRAQKAAHHIAAICQRNPP